MNGFISIGIHQDSVSVALHASRAALKNLFQWIDFVSPTGADEEEIAAVSIVLI